MPFNICYCAESFFNHWLIPPPPEISGTIKENGNIILQPESIFLLLISDWPLSCSDQQNVASMMCKFQSKPQEVLRKRSLGTLRPPWRCPRLASLRIKAHTERRVRPSQPTPSSVWGSQGEQKKGCLTLRITRNINHCFMPLNFRWFHTPNYHFFFSLMSLTLRNSILRIRIRLKILNLKNILGSKE